MSKSKIEWTEETWNALIGCDKVSAGCKNCYAIKTAWIRMHNPAMKEKYAGTVEKTANGSLNWTGKVSMHEESLLKPLKARKPTVYFVNSMSDLFHKDVPWNFIYKVFEVMLLTPQHTYQVLTKRAERLHEINDINLHLQRNYPDATLPLKNVWIGVSVEDQKAANERMPYLNLIPAAVKFLSCEPLLGPVDLHKALDHTLKYHAGGLKNCISWVIAGGESGPGARPMHPDWARSLRDQCAAADVPYFFKQWGNYLPIDQPWQQDSPKGLAANEQWLNRDGGQGFHGQEVYRMRNVGKKAAGRLLDGQLHDAYPV